MKKLWQVHSTTACFFRKVTYLISQPPVTEADSDAPGFVVYQILSSSSFDEVDVCGDPQDAERHREHRGQQEQEVFSARSLVHLPQPDLSAPLALYHNSWCLARWLFLTDYIRQRLPWNCSTVRGWQSLRIHDFATFPPLHYPASKLGRLSVWEISSFIILHTHTASFWLRGLITQSDVPLRLRRRRKKGALSSSGTHHKSAVAPKEEEQWRPASARVETETRCIAQQV